MTIMRRESPLTVGTDHTAHLNPHVVEPGVALGSLLTKEMSVVSTHEADTVLFWTEPAFLLVHATWIGWVLEKS